MGTRATARNQREQVAPTREQILETAERLFLEKGFRATSVHEIASESGFTTGALYWNFDGKDELFLEILERRLKRTMAAFQARGLDRLLELPDPGAALAAAIVDSPQEPAWVAVLFEYLAYAVRHEELRERVIGVCEPYEEAFAKAFTKLFEGSKIPPARLASALNALMNGLWLGAFVFPDRTDVTVFGDVASVFVATKE
jgi:AcrR family transcriptional regulator